MLKVNVDQHYRLTAYHRYARVCLACLYCLFICHNVVLRMNYFEFIPTFCRVCVRDLFGVYVCIFNTIIW